jgi:hypothetical protein
MDRGPIMLAHFVELVDQANPLVSKYQSSGLQFPLICREVSLDAGSQPHSGGSFSSCIHASVKSLLETLQKLRFRYSRISKEQNIDISSDSVSAFD